MQPSHLILVFTYGMSLRQWRDTGMLGRELALYHALSPAYDHILLVTYGGPDEHTILASHLQSLTDQPRALLRPEQVSVLCNEQRLPIETFAQQLPGKIVERLNSHPPPHPPTGVVVKTNQLASGLVAADIAQALRNSGYTAALIARGGYLWSAFMAHEHGDSSPQAIEARRVERSLCQAADIVVGTTDDMLAAAIATHGLDAARTRLIPNYIITDSEVTSAVTRDPLLILYAGQLVGRKRVDVLLRAAARAAQTVPGLRLSIVGDGPDREPLERLAQELHAPASFEGRIPHAQLMQRMRQCAIYAQPSALEGHPKTVIEAMACGTPVIVTAAPGMSVVEHNRTGLCVPDHADVPSEALVEPLADAFVTLLNNPAMREAMGQRAAQVAAERFSLAAIIKLERAAHEQAFERAFNSR